MFIYSHGKTNVLKHTPNKRIPQRTLGEANTVENEWLELKYFERDAAARITGLVEIFRDFHVTAGRASQVRSQPNLQVVSLTDKKSIVIARRVHDPSVD